MNYYLLSGDINMGVNCCHTWSFVLYVLYCSMVCSNPSFTVWKAGIFITVILALTIPLKINNNLISPLSVTIFGYKKHSNNNNNNNNHHHHHFCEDNYNGHTNTYVICNNSNFIFTSNYKYIVKRM